jgi:hypothetical protein
MDKDCRHKFRIVDEDDILLCESLAKEKASNRLIGKIYLNVILFVLDKTFIIKINLTKFITASCPAFETWRLC